MKRLAVILLILGAAATVPSIICMISANYTKDGYDALARSMLGIPIIGAAILLAVSSAAVFTDIHIKNKRKGKQQNESKN